MESNPPYRLPFGKHKNQTLEEVPPSYRSWLIKDEVYADKPALKAALIAGNYLSPTSNPYTPPSSPKPYPPPLSTPSRKRPAPDDTVLEESPSSRRKIAISSAARRNGTMLNYDGSAYILDFGQHAGSKLSDVPQSYISWLINAGAHTSRRDLEAALREQGFLATTEDNTPPSSGQSAPSSGRTGVWSPPSVHEAPDARFFDTHMRMPRWISDNDALRYFGLRGTQLSERAVALVTEEELRREAEFSELVSISKGPKRWLYQVYICAARFKSVPPNRGTAENALRDFLGKNQRREEEIWDALGFGI